MFEIVKPVLIAGRQLCFQTDSKSKKFLKQVVTGIEW